MIDAIGVILFLIFLLYVWSWFYCASGKITLAPSEGTIHIPTPRFKPRKVDVELCGCPKLPGCSQLEDSVEVESLDCNGFTLRYRIQSGMRVVKWKACA